MAHYPTVFNIISLKHSLSHSLPNELIEIILDFAEYWPHSSCSSTSSIKARGQVCQDAQHHCYAEWRQHRGPEATTPRSFADSSEDGFVLRSVPLGIHPTDNLQFQASLIPLTQHPVRMIIFEIRYYRLFACDPVRRRRDIVRYSSTCLELGIKKPMPSSESPPRAVLEPATRPTAQVVEGNPRLQRTSDRVYHAWDLKRNLCSRGNAKVDLYMSQMALADGMVGQKTVVWRTDDDDLAGAKFLDDGWDLSGQPWSRLSETEKAHARDFIHSLAKEDRRKQVNFMKQLEVGDSLGVWVRVSNGPYGSKIEGMRMHVFWAAS